MEVDCSMFLLVVTIIFKASCEAINCQEEKRANDLFCTHRLHVG